MGKLPFIPDKKLYAAVMGACAYVRDTGYFNKATEYYADKYGVEVEDVRKYVRMAQGAGQRAANKDKPKRKYYYFAIEYSLGNERNGADYFEILEAQYAIRRGISCETVTQRMSAHDDLASEYAPCHWFGRIAGFDTEDEAIRNDRRIGRRLVYCGTYNNFAACTIFYITRNRKILCDSRKSCCNTG